MTTEWMQASSLELTGAATPAWTREYVHRIGKQNYPQAPVIADDKVQPVAEGLVFWDLWPLAQTDGRTCHIAGGELWFGLAAPREPDPDLRHDVARIRLLHRIGGRWLDLGWAMPDRFSPRAREWSGTAILQGSDSVTLFFTAAGRRSDPHRTFEQRLFQASATLDISGGRPNLKNWGHLIESVRADGDIYLEVSAGVGEPGHVKALRDPAYFRDPADGADYLLFAASLGRSKDRCNGMIGLARASGDTLDRWVLEPPLPHADGVNNELERPHVLIRDDLYYVFWCTQRPVFAPGLSGPTGLYGVVGHSLRGPFRPINGSGLVFANPVNAPKQAYAWWVTKEGRAWGFVDDMTPRGNDGIEKLSIFIGAPAPPLNLDFHRGFVNIEK